MRQSKRTESKAELAEVVAEAGIDPTDPVAVAAARVDLYERSLAWMPKRGKAAQVAVASTELALRNARRVLADLRGEDRAAVA